MTDKELLEMAMKLKEHCEGVEFNDCKHCVFNKGYGVDTCVINDIPEVWNVEDKYERVSDDSPNDDNCCGDIQTDF